MKISVACCTLNGASFLDEQLASLAGQTKRPDEIVIVDDGSSDESPQIVADFARRMANDIAVVVERNPRNLGVVKNFEKAIALTSGDIVFLCDQDDVWRPDKVETMVRRFQSDERLLLLFSDARMVDARGAALKHSLFEALEVTRRERGLLRAGDGFAALIGRNLVTGATAAIRRSLFESAAPFPAEWIHDEWLAIVAAATGSVAACDDRLIDYRQHDANQIGMRRLTLDEKFGRLFRPRADHYVKLQRRTEILLAKLESLGPVVGDERIRMVLDKLAHVQFRVALPRQRLTRLVPIVRELASGRYVRYSSGLRSIVRDCLEPS